MSAEFPDRVFPVGEAEMLRPTPEHSGGTTFVPHRGRSVMGAVVAVHARAHRAAEEGHRLDITVGEEPAHTEIVVRVPHGAYHDFEGRRVTLHIEE